MADRRTIEALRALAERPGTEAEGKLAREMLDRIESKYPPLEDEWQSFGAYLRNGNLSDLIRATGYKTCPCGNRHSAFTSCPLIIKHQTINAEMRDRFPRGTRIYYNYWAYEDNDPGVVVGYSHEWNWIRIKFDKLKNSRGVPVYDTGEQGRGWCITTEPLGPKELEQTYKHRVMRDAEAWVRERFADGPI